jgi:pyruvate formate lyase activating enzyme
MKWFQIEKDSITCLLCGHKCKLRAGATGVCGVNKNTGKKLECLVYAHPCAVHIDPIEKKPLYHFLPGTLSFSLGTVGCNFRCPFCQNWQISQTHEIDTSQQLSPELAVQNALRTGCESISFTYNEPTIFYPYAKDIALSAKKEGLKTIFVTNGFMSSQVVQDMQGVIDAVNIDIKSFDATYYKKVLKGDLDTVLNNAKALKKGGVWVEITTLIIPNRNDSDEELQSIAAFIANELGVDTPWHISAFFPTYKELSTQKTPLQTLSRAKQIGKTQGLSYVYCGNTGVMENTFCPTCDALVIGRDYEKGIECYLKNGVCLKCKTKIAGVFDA